MVASVADTGGQFVGDSTIPDRKKRINTENVCRSRLLAGFIDNAENAKLECLECNSPFKGTGSPDGLGIQLAYMDRSRPKEWSRMLLKFSGAPSFIY
jgi:hypothetical protein